MSGWWHNLAAGLAKRFSLRDPPRWFIDCFGGGESSSGVRVGHQKAMQFTPFWAAVRIISGTIASLPFKVYRNLEGGGKEPITDHRAYRLLHDRPNDYVDAVTFLETRMAQVLCYGNAYAEIQRDGAGRPVALWPLLPDRTSRKITEAGQFIYEVRLPAGDTVTLPDADVLHIKGLGADAYTGYDVVTYHKEALGYGIAVKEFGSRFFSNNAQPGGNVEHPGQMSEPAYKHFKESWNEAHQGLENAHRVAILEEGMKFHEYGVDPQKAQALEVQKWTVDDCCRIFQIPPHMLGSMEFSKYNNVEELRIDFLTMTMLYWFRKWEQECSYKLLMPSERGRLFCEFVADGLLRGNVAARTQYYMAGRQWGWLSVDDIREKENMNPLPDGKGKIYLEPLNMRPAGSPDPKPPSPEPASKDTPDDGEEDPIRSTHRDILRGLMRRIITKQRKAGPGKLADAEWWRHHQEWARDILRDPVAAYAHVRGLRMEDSLPILLGVLDGCFSKYHTIHETDAETIAETLLSKIDQIGGNHHA